MKDQKPHLTDRSTHLDFPFRLSDDLSKIEYSGVRTLEGSEVKKNGITLLPYIDVYDPGSDKKRTFYFDWGPVDDAIRDPYHTKDGFACLAQTILNDVLIEGFAIDENYARKLPRWHRTHRLFVFYFYRYPLALALEQLPDEEFLITHKDIQTAICDFMLQDKWWQDPKWKMVGKLALSRYSLDKRIGRIAEKDPLSSRLIFWLIFSTIFLGIPALLIWLLYRLVLNLIE